ncbi:cupin domain-containing protein, partial [Streptomyces sp. NPDC057654]|uniref:cupin domain-containing protein n=1 Tax=Streptomyces sp. NPDC057654 TaxID=3346196 RepID=UPI00367C0044
AAAPGRRRMTGKRVTAVLLAVAAVTAVGACGSEAEHETAGARAGATASTHPPATPPPLFQQELPNVKGKTFTARTVEFPPAGHAPPHRHGRAFVYAYVLDGAVRSKLEGQPTHTYRQGENRVEQPGAHHVTTENTSRTEPARLLVVYVSNTGDELKVDDPPGRSAAPGQER